MIERAGRRAFVAGALAAAVMSLAMWLLREASGVRSLPEMLGEAVVTLMPPTLFSALLDLMLRAAKPTLIASLIAGQLVVGALIGWRYALAPSARRAAVTVLVVWLVVGLIAMPILGLGVFGQAARVGPIVVGAMLLAVFAVYGLALYVLERALRPAGDGAETAAVPGRRRALARVGLGLAAVAVGGYGWRVLAGQTAAPRPAAQPIPVEPPPDRPAAGGAASGSDSPADIAAQPAALAPAPTAVPVAKPIVGTIVPGAPAAPPFDVRGLSPEVTPTDDFYTVSKNFVDPKVDMGRWLLTIDGLVETPLELKYDDVKALPTVSNFYTLQCISNPVGGDLWGNAYWKGVRLADLLNMAGIKPGVKKAVFYGADDYTDSIVLDRALNPETIVAYEMNGAPLEHAHGYPVRILVPNIYGMKNVKWVTRIELVDHNFQGYWMVRGWSDAAPYRVSSRIDAPASRSTPSPGELELGGVAFAGERGIKTVEISLDDGKSWQPAQVKPALARNAWNLWVARVNVAPGTYSIKVRATDGQGELQDWQDADPLPDGASGYHTVLVRVV